jgi:hypothetical protein
MTQFEWPNRSLYFKRHTTAKTAASDHDSLRSCAAQPLINMLFCPDNAIWWDFQAVLPHAHFHDLWIL